MSAIQLRDARFLTVLWNEKMRTIGINWKETTAAMTDGQFRSEPTLFAADVEEHEARRILVDVSQFRHKMGPDVQQWRVTNISNRYNAAGVTRFAFLFPAGSQVPPVMTQSSPGEDFLTRAFTSREQALAWLTA